MPLVRENGTPLSEGDQTWLGSTRGITKCRTEKLDVSAFASIIAAKGGYIPSGMPVAFATVPTAADHGMLVPYDPQGSGGTTLLQGFLFTDQKVYPGQTEDINVPLLDHGRIIIHRLPVGAFEAPATSNGNFVFEA